MPEDPKVASSALSSNSPTTRGTTPCCSNHWSIRRRTEACELGNSTGTSARLCGKLRLAGSSQACGAYQPSGEEPMAWL
ncbi:hypothetical protein FQZ97_1230600 [compost metagenome]